MKMNSNKGLFFQTEMDVVVEWEIRGRRLETRHTLRKEKGFGWNSRSPLFSYSNWLRGSDLN